MLLELGTRNSADHLILCEMMVFRTLGGQQKNAGAERQCKGEEGLKGRYGQNHSGV